MSAVEEAYLSPAGPALPQPVPTAEAPLLVDTAARGLPRMYDHQSGLFCYSLERTGQGLSPRGSSPRYTLIALLGLNRLNGADTPAFLDVPSALKRVMREHGQVDKLGNLGLLLWACAQILPEELENACRGLELKSAADRYPDGRLRKTRELAWLLAGLCYAYAMHPSDSLAGSSRQVLELVLKNFVPATGLFCHQAGGPFGNCRRRVANFDDQAYTVYSLALCWRTFGWPAALNAALSCGRTLQRLQGPLGQWWWHYDAATGRVLSTYPVYSVNQDGVAPMAFLGLSAASGVDFRGPVLKGLAWLAGRNELGRSLVDPEAGVIWRGVERRGRYSQRIEEALAFAVHYRMPGNTGSLVVRQNCRPYHLGWLLYAWAAGGRLRAQEEDRPATGAASGVGQ
jgi:hypothetical protein